VTGLVAAVVVAGVVTAVVALRPGTAPPAPVPTGAPSSPPASGEAPSGPAQDSSSPAPGDGATSTRLPGDRPSPQGIDARGCGWFFAYEPDVLRALRENPATTGLAPSPRRLIESAVLGETAAVRDELDTGTDPDIVVPGFDYTPLTAAVSARCRPLVDTLLTAGADPDLRAPGREPPLVLSVLLDDPGTAERLLDAGADPTITSADGIDIVTLARLLGRDDILIAFARAGVPDPIRSDPAPSP
jgi:hypothetical protein